MHLPAMVGEVRDFLKPETGGIYVDCTLGDGGHTQAILMACGPGGFIVAIDRDREAIQSASERLAEFRGRVAFFHGNYKEIRKFVQEAGHERVDGVLFDLGVSTRQLLIGARGFSFKNDGALDMRMDRDQKLSAVDMVNRYTRADLKGIIGRFGEERYAGRIASAIVREREKLPIETTHRLAEIIRSAVPPSHPHRATDSVTRTFQGIRIAVNDELPAVETAVREAVDILKPGGRICVISYHSLEDRIAKTVFRELEKECICPPAFPICVCDKQRTVRILTRKPLMPSKEEVTTNPRVRSAKLRAAEKSSKSSGQ